MDKFIVMPNHMHRIVIIDNDLNSRDVPSECLYTGNHPNMSNISPKKTSISHMIREFKSAVTKIVRQSIPEFSWQSRFYDHIIQNEISLYNIRRYINYNPKMWNRDRNNKFRIGDVI